MKKTIITTLAVMGLAACVNAQGYFTVDGGANGGDNATPTSTTGGLVFIDGVLDTATDINLGILWGTSSTSILTPVNLDPGAANSGAYAGNINFIASQSTGGQDISFNGDGSLLDFNGNSYAVTGTSVGQVIWLVLQGWTGSAASYAQATTFGQTAAFQVTLTSSTAQPAANIDAMPSLNLVTTSVPEPTSLALAGLGGFGMLMALRRKQA
jgi:hypothetical protein